MTDVIAKDYDYSFFSQLADVIAFIVCGRYEPHLNRYCLLGGRWNGHMLQQLDRCYCQVVDNIAIDDVMISVFNANVIG